MALGFFDGVHLGHAAVIRQAVENAAALGIKTAVATFARHPSEFLGGEKSPLLTANELKQEIFNSLGVDRLFYIDFCAVRGMTPPEFIENVLIRGLKAQFVVCGYNYRFGAGASGGVEEMAFLCARHGAGFRAMPPVSAGGGPVSSTRIRSLVAGGEMEAAAKLLGRPYAIKQKVAHGKMLGRRLGFPTINQPVAEGLCLPRFGVYASHVVLDGESRPGVTNIGVRPTVGGAGVVAETYIPGFEGDLYGKEPRLDFLRFIRAEKKFGSVGELREQIARDIKAAE